MRLAHLSDPHLGPLPPVKPWQLASKRLLGYLNWIRNRSRAMGVGVLETLVHDLKDQSVDHVAVTGDLVNIGLPGEYRTAANWLAELGDPQDVSVVPGNHDAYVPGGLKRARASWSEHFEGDPAWAHERTFPFVRLRGEMAIVGVSTAVATAPFMATGRLNGYQRKRLERVLKRLGEDGYFRVLMIHHPIGDEGGFWHKRLVDAGKVRALLARTGAELVLHGHTHRLSIQRIAGANGWIPMVGVPSASHGFIGTSPAGRYNLFDISRNGDGWRVVMSERGPAAPDGDVETLDQRVLLA